MAELDLQAGRAISASLKASSPGQRSEAGGRPDHRGPRWFREMPGPAVAGLVGIAYFLLAQYVLWLNDPVHEGAGYWPAAGVTLTALLLLPTRRWGWVVAAVAVAEVGGGALHGYPLAASSWWAAGNVLEPMLAAFLLGRFGKGLRLVPLAALASFLVAGVVIGPMVGAAIGSFGTSTVYGASQIDVFLKWWVGDGLGVLVVAPLLLGLLQPALARRSRIESGAVVAVAVAITLVAFVDWGQQWEGFLRYLILPALVVAGVRLGIRGAALTNFLVAEIANLSTALGSAPLRTLGGSDVFAITELQVFLAVALASALLIAALVHDALEATRDYGRQRSIADEFQVAALPQRLPTVAGLSMAAGYRAASADDSIHVGGDWYDAFPLPDGSTGLVIGDVTGHDLSAAVRMAEVRNGLRSLLIELRDPAGVLAAMNEQLALDEDLVLVTAVACLYAEGHLVWSNAGHLPLLYAPNAGPVRYLAAEPNRLLGTGRTHYDTHRTPLSSGDVVVAYTDGVIEHRTRSLDEGFEHMARLVATAPSRDPRSLCDRLLENGLAGQAREDDACVLAIQRS